MTIKTLNGRPYTNDSNVLVDPYNGASGDNISIMFNSDERMAKVNMIDMAMYVHNLTNYNPKSWILNLRNQFVKPEQELTKAQFSDITDIIQKSSEVSLESVIDITSNAGNRRNKIRYHKLKPGKHKDQQKIEHIKLNFLGHIGMITIDPSSEVILKTTPAKNSTTYQASIKYTISNARNSTGIEIIEQTFEAKINHN